MEQQNLECSKCGKKSVFSIVFECFKEYKIVLCHACYAKQYFPEVDLNLIAPGVCPECLGKKVIVKTNEKSYAKNKAINCPTCQGQGSVLEYENAPLLGSAQSRKKKEVQ